jgi:predicted nucleic acid-binding protein
LALLIDTSVFIALERSGAPPLELLVRFGDESAALSTVTASELLHGVHRADGAVRRMRREAFVEAIFDALPILPFTLEVARIHARLWADLQARGEVIGAHDIQIAATTLSHDLTLVSGNRRHFERVPELSFLLWA